MNITLFHLQGSNGGLVQTIVLKQQANGNLKFTVLNKMPYLGPMRSTEHSLRFLDSALAGSDEFSPTPLMINAYQCLKNIHKKTKFRQIFRSASNYESYKVCEKQLCKLCTCPYRYLHVADASLCCRAQVDPLQEK